MYSQNYGENPSNLLQYQAVQFQTFVAKNLHANISLRADLSNLFLQQQPYRLNNNSRGIYSIIKKKLLTFTFYLLQEFPPSLRLFAVAFSSDFSAPTNNKSGSYSPTSAIFPDMKLNSLKRVRFKGPNCRKSGERRCCKSSDICRWHHTIDEETEINVDFHYWGDKDFPFRVIFRLTDSSQFWTLPGTDKSLEMFDPFNIRRSKDLKEALAEFSRLWQWMKLLHTVCMINKS